jgi:hypothetical protein
MASNAATIADEFGEYEDWIELHNDGVAAFDLGGLYMTDTLSNLTKWPVPAGVTIPPRGWRLIWADEDEDQGPTHADFKLSAGGEQIALVDRDGATIIDFFTFGAQTTDISFGRLPDGGDATFFFDHPTPGASNLILGDADFDADVDLDDYAFWPACVIGPVDATPPEASCDPFDFDADVDVDVRDWAAFQNAFDGG